MIDISVFTSFESLVSLDRNESYAISPPSFSEGSNPSLSATKNTSLLGEVFLVRSKSFVFLRIFLSVHPPIIIFVSKPPRI